MRKKSVVLASFLSICSITAWSQNPEAQLVKINDSIYKVRDFERLYNKNLDLITDENQKDVSNYLDLYILFKLKLQKAYALNLDQKPSFKDEWLMHRNQLAEKYLVNENRLNDLIEEALVRSKEEIHAKHILVKVDEYASSKDTLNAYQKAIEIREKILNGLDFEEAAKLYSDDKSALTNGGDLGYFSVFRMVFPFETGAYLTPVGQISLPVRSQFGYHLIQVVDRREKPRDRDVSHIFIEKTPERPLEESRAQANLIYQKLKNGEDFGELAHTYSEDNSGRANYGAMGRFYEHNFDIPQVGEKVYALQEGQFSQPIESKYGFHIFKVDRILPVPSEDYLRMEFTRKVKNDSRSNILEKELIDYLSKEYDVKLYDTNISKIKQCVNEDFFTETWKTNALPKAQLVLFTFDNNQKSVTGEEYIEWLDTRKNKYSRFDRMEAIANASFEQFQKDVLKKYYDQNLSKKHPEFKQIVEEYKEGLLLFELLESQIWEPARANEEALLTFYEQHKESYRKPATYKGVVYEFESQKDAEKWYQMISQNSEIPFEGFAKARKFETTIQKGLPNRLNIALEEVKDGLIAKNNKVYVFVKPDIKPSYIPDFQEAKKQVVSEYTQKYEADYYNNLLKNSNIDIDHAVFEQVKRKYSK